MRIIGYGIAAIVAGVSLVWGLDQHSQRKNEENRFQQEITLLEKLIANKEQEYIALASRLGKKNDQVRKFAHEIQRLRTELAEARRRAAA